MLEILQFAFSSAWIYFGLLFFVLAVMTMAGLILISLFDFR